MENVNVTDNANTALNTDSVEAQKPLKLSEFIQREGLELENGKYKPTKNKQLKDLVNCIDDDTNELISLAKIDTSNITSMKELFARSKRTNFTGIDEWDTSKVTTFELMFFNTEFNEDISGWNVSSGRNFQSMFERTIKFDKPIGAKWDTGSATNMIRMFRFAVNFNNGGAEFGDKWKMDKVGWTWEMFWGAEKFNQKLNHWKMSSVTKCYKMFMNAKAFNQSLDGWDLSNAVDLSSMFNKAESFNQNLSAWGNNLGKAQDMQRMFADTKALDINFLQDWQIPADCIFKDIIKGSKLEQILKNPKAQNVENKTQDKKRKLKDIAKFTISQIKNSNVFQETCKNLSKNKGFVVNKNSWIPNKILNSYEVYLGKDNEDTSSKDKIIKADIDDFNYAFCRVFDDTNLVISIDDADIPLDENDKINTFEVYQAKNIKEFNELNGDDDEVDKYSKAYTTRKDDNIEFYLADTSMLIINKQQDSGIGDNSNIISDIINAYILAKAYKAKMQQLNTRASEYKEKNLGGKIIDFLSFWKDDVLHKVHKDICNFDLKYYQKDPVDKNKVVLDIWREMSKSYLVAQTHDELKETIKQVAELVSEENQKRFNYLMLVVAIFSAIGAILAAVPVIKGF